VTTKRGKGKPGAGSSPRRKEKLAVSIIGSGRLGLALGTALLNAGVSIDVAVTRTNSSARRAARLLRAPAVAARSKGLGELPPRYRALLQQTNLILIAAPDDFVPEIAKELTDVLSSGSGASARRFRRPSAVMHTSGALTSRVLKPIQRLGIPVGSIHPLVSISSQDKSSRPFSSVYFSVEGDAAAVRWGRQLVRNLKGHSFILQTRNKPLYHAAALMASPNLTALVDIAIEMMSRSGVSASQATRMLLPLIGSTVANLTHQDPARALTGTFKRGDLATAKMHLDAIASQRLTDALRAYLVLGERSLKLSDISKTKKAAIRDLLSQAVKRSARD
jgi:predicted short-subunit dehydrogenase-like oxidoreductase (DUF2520 family)